MKSHAKQENLVSRFLRLVSPPVPALLAAVFFILAGGQNAFASAFSGRVVDSQGRPVSNARVEVNGKTAATRSDGSFQLVVPTHQLYIVNISHPNFADATRISRVPLSGQTWRMVGAQISTVDPRKEIVLRDKRPVLRKERLGGATFSLPPNSLVDVRGRPPAGAVRAAIATLNVSNGEGPGDWAVRSDDGTQDGYLISYGATFIQFTDPSGRVRYQLKKGRSAKLSLPVIPTMLSHASDAPQARFWYFDSKDGYWKRAGLSKFDARLGVYVGTVDHLSTINTDIAKFDNAACLKVTRDATVPAGLRLRVRYHSGGTPFGQSPTFALMDVDNAAYRLPSNTNVLLELLDAGDETFGNLVVEQPPGTALVNTVVNTGAALPPGSSLWPPAPYVPCRPIVVRLGLPQVEIRINERLEDIATKDNSSDDYLSWAPTFGLARLTTPMPGPVNVVLTNDTPDMGGDMVFAPYADPWPPNTTATADTLTLTLPGDGAWVPFVIAGKFLSPSIDDKDAILEVHQGTATGSILARKAMMVRVRKNANSLQPSERSRFLHAWKNFRNASGINYYYFQEMHRLAGTTSDDEAHMQPAFLPWHRTMLLHVERELQRLDPSVSLHYWNWDAAAPNIFSRDFMGEGYMRTDTDPFDTFEPVFAVDNPLNGWPTSITYNGGRLLRSKENHQRNPNGAMRPLANMLADWVDYGPASPRGTTVASFSDDVERRSHNPAHGWACTSGHITSPRRSPVDPLFYMLHSQIDREWAHWQRARNAHGDIIGGTLTITSPHHYANTGSWSAGNPWYLGSYLDDGMWPWDGTSGGLGPSGRPVNQAAAGDPDVNITTSRPLISSAPFPASSRKHLWPATATIPRPRHMIDYMGRFRPQDGHGVSYDDVPY